MRRFIQIACLFGFGLCSCGPQFDHRIDQQLGLELANRSKSGLGLARFNREQNVLDVHLLDGRDEKVPLEVDGEPKVITHGRIAIVDQDPHIRDKIQEAALQRNSELIRELFSNLGGNIVLLSNTGKIERRSAMSVNAITIAVSPDGQRIAYVGVPKGISEAELGLYIGDFDSPDVKRIFSFDSDDPRLNGSGSGSMKSTLDWSPDAATLLFSQDGTITVFDANTGLSRKIAAGGSARWSPSGEQISFVALPRLEASLLEWSTGKVSAIDPGFKIPGAMEWSPDGKYLLIPEGEGSHVEYGCHWVKRISDAAFFPVCKFRITNPLPVWFQF